MVQLQLDFWQPTRRGAVPREGSGLGRMRCTRERAVRGKLRCLGRGELESGLFLLLLERWVNSYCRRGMVFVRRGEGSSAFPHAAGLLPTLKVPSSVKVANKVSTSILSTSARILAASRLVGMFSAIAEVPGWQEVGWWLLTGERRQIEMSRTSKRVSVSRFWKFCPGPNFTRRTASFRPPRPRLNEVTSVRTRGLGGPW